MLHLYCPVLTISQSKSAWLKQNKDVNKRAARDVELRDAELDRRSYESIQAKLAKKTRQYNQLKRGLTGGLSEAQLAEQNVDVCRTTPTKAH